MTTPQPDSPEDILENKFREVLIWFGADIARTELTKGTLDTDGLEELITTKVKQALAKLSEYYTNKQEKGRYCGICYKPCIERGGWKCPNHGYQSVYIGRQEAKECRDEFYTNKFLEARETIVQADTTEVEAKTKDWREGYRRAVHIAVSAIDTAIKNLNKEKP